MKKIKIAYISTTGLDIFPLITALKELETEKGDVAEVILRSKDDLADPKTMDDFMSFAAGSDLAILSLHGGKAILGSFDEIVLRINEANVPLYAQDTSKLDPELMSISTVDRDVHTSIFRYLAYGGKDNCKNLLLYCLNQFLGTSYEVGEPKRPPGKGYTTRTSAILPRLMNTSGRTTKKAGPQLGCGFTTASGRPTT